MQDFFSNASLYQKFQLKGSDYDLADFQLSPFFFSEKAFDYICPHEQGIKTFSLELLDYDRLMAISERHTITIPEEFLIDGKMNYTIHLKGKCRSCQKYNNDFLINIYTDEKLPQSWLGMDYKGRPYPEDLPFPIYIQKVGVNPEKKVIPNKSITHFFDRESGKWYFKGINAIDKNFGIGALAYFRRIVEKELIHIIEDIKKLPDSHEMEIQKLLDKHNEDPHISTIYDNVFQYLPNSLKSLGNNPIKFLYNQTSEGLHSLSENEAMERAQGILRVLEYVIIKMNEERSSIKDLREIMKSFK